MIYDVCYALCCRPCATGLSLQSVGMPCWLGACCVSPFGAVSILRYHQRIKPDVHSEVVTDCVVPSLMLACGQNTGNFTSYFVNFFYTFMTLVEQNERVGRSGCYGLDCLQCCQYIGSYCSSGCVCGQHDSGRYLLNDEGLGGVVNQQQPGGYAPVSMDGSSHSYRQQQQLPLPTVAVPMAAVQQQHTQSQPSAPYVHASKVMY
jgi:hypothetical protein